MHPHLDLEGKNQFQIWKSSGLQEVLIERGRGREKYVVYCLKESDLNKKMK